MNAVRCNEVDERLRVLDAAPEFRPARIWLEIGISGFLVELLADTVERCHAGVTAAREVDCRKVQRQTEKIVAQRIGNEFVDAVGDLACCSAHDLRCSIAVGATLRIGERVEEGVNQAELLIARHLGIGVDHVAVGIDTVNRLAQQRVPEPIDRVRELGHDRGIDLDVVRLEFIDVRLDAACKVLEDKMLVLHLGPKSGGLEQVLAIPFTLLDAVGHIRARLQPLAHECRIVVRFGQDHLLQVPDQPVVFRVENVMNGGQADILIPASVAGDVVGIEQLIVVVAARIRPVKVREADLRVAVRDLAGRNGIMGNVVKEGVSGADRPGGADGIGGVAFCQDVVGRARNAVSAGHHELGVSMSSRHEAPIRVGCQQGNVGHIGIGQVDAEQLPRLRLDVSPCCQAAIGAFEQTPGCHRIAVGVKRVLAQKNLV